VLAWESKQAFWKKSGGASAAGEVGLWKTAPQATGYGGWCLELRRGGRYGKEDE